MTLHYAPTTPEEEELALALALSASLSSAPGKAVGEPSVARNARASESGASDRSIDVAARADQRRATSPRRASGNAALYIPLSLNPSLIYPQLPPPSPPPPAIRRPSPSAGAPPRPPAPAASASANSLLQRPPSHAPPRNASSSPPRNRWPSDSTTSSSPWSTRSQPPTLGSQPLANPPGASPGRPFARRPLTHQNLPQQQYSPSHIHPEYPLPGHPPQYGGQPQQPTQYLPKYPPIYPQPPPLPQQQQQQIQSPKILAQSQPHLPPIVVPPPPPPAANTRSKSPTRPSILSAAGGLSGPGGGGGSGSVPPASTSTSAFSSTNGGGGGIASALPPPQPMQLYSDPDACAGCGRGFGGLFGRSWVSGMDRKWHAGCFKCGFCREPISSGRGAFSYQMHPGDPLPYHSDCYRHVHHPLCHVCGSYISASPEGVISYRENGFWRERYCTTHGEAELTRCCACSRLQKQGEEWAPLADGRPLCLQCLSSVVLDTLDAQPLYSEVLSFYAREMHLPHAYNPPLLLVDGPTLNSHAQAEGRDDSGGAPVFHVRGLCVATVYSHIASMRRDVAGNLRSTIIDLCNPPTAAAAAASAADGSAAAAASRVHCHVKLLLLLYGLPRLLSGSIMAHELMHAWLRMEGVAGLSSKVEEGLCQLMACLWLDRQHELLKGKPEEQRLASFFSYQIRTDTSEVYGDGFREAMEAFQSIGFSALIQNVKRYGRYT